MASKMVPKSVYTTTINGEVTTPNATRRVENKGPALADVYSPSRAVNSAVECHLHTLISSNPFNNLTRLYETAKYL